MSPRTPMLRDAALALPLALGAGALMGGVGLAAECAFCTLLAVLNVGLLRFLVTRATTAAVEGHGPGWAGSLLSVKLLLTLAGVWLLFQFVHPLAVVTGVIAVLGALTVTGTVESLHAEALS